MGLKIGSKIKRLGKRLNNEVSRWGDDIDAQAKRAERGELFGSSEWGRMAANWTGATTTARLVRRARNHEDVSPGDVVDDASVMRPSRGYSDAMNGPVKEMEMRAKEEARKTAETMERHRAAEEQKARDAISVRVRRARMDHRVKRMGGLAGGLGVSGSRGGTFSSLLGLPRPSPTFSSLLGGG